MITIIIPTHNDGSALAHMLPPLVHELIHGPINDVIVHDNQSEDETRQICEIAGCKFIDAANVALGKAINEARGSWLLFLPPGALLSAGWSTHVAQHIDQQAGHGAPAVFSLARDPDASWWQRLIAPQKSRHPVLPRGFLVSRQHALNAINDNGSLEDLMRGRAAKRLRAELYVPRRD